MHSKIVAGDGGLAMHLKQTNNLFIFLYELNKYQRNTTEKLVIISTPITSFNVLKFPSKLQLLINFSVSD